MWKPGTLHKIKLKDFVTYSDIELFPGSHINILVGANGTGKSTLCAAMILGLGGTPKTIGRATKVSEYIKHGCTEARIDIELFSRKNGEMLTISRIMNVNNQNVWFMNNTHTTETEVKNTVEKLNIQVNNLCQFLPQDRVQDFAKLDRQELLANTEKAIGRQDLLDKHEQLIELRKRELEMIHATEQTEKKLQQIKDDVSRMEGRVQNLQEKRNIKKDIDDIKRKISWAHYAEALRAKEEIEKDKRDAEKMLSRHKKRIQPLENQVQGMKDEITATQAELIETKKEMRSSIIHIRELLEEANNVDVSYNSVISETRIKIRGLQEFKAEIDVMKVKIDKLKNDESGLLGEHNDVKGILQAVENCKMTESVLRKKCDKMIEDRLNAQSVLERTESQAELLEDRIKSMENVKERRIKTLLSKDRDAYDALMWLRQNLGMFKGRIYEPIMIELNVANPDHCKYIENIIPFRDRVAFTCELREDMNLFLETVGPKWSVNALHSGAEHPALNTYQSNIPIGDITKYGFFAYANTLVTGPEPIMKYLCRMYNLQNIPIGDSSVADHLTNIPPNIRLFFSDTQRFAVAESRYTNQKSTRVSSVESDCTFSLGTDREALEEIRKQLRDFQVAADKMRDKIKAFETQQEILEQKRLDAIKEKNTHLMHIEQLKMLREKKSIAEQTLEQRLKEFKTEAQFKEEANKRIKNIIKNGTCLHKTIQTSINAYTELGKKSSTLSISLTAIYARVEHLQNQHSTLLDEYKEAVQTVATINEHLKDSISEMKSCLQAAKKLSNNFKPEDDGFDQYRDSFERLPSKLDALKALALEKQTQIECILTADDDEIKQYEDNVVEARRLEMVVDDYKQKVQNERNAIESVREQWLEPLREIVQQINRNFAGFYASMGCCGEVSVICDEQEDFSSYGLSIRVKHRKKEELQELNRFVQSGGERAVATALYLLALQDLSAAPFRCVDEINQGMDPQNERRVFEIITQVASEGGQYFLITPKLLPKLKFGPNMKVHIVHNGPFLNVN